MNVILHRAETREKAESWADHYRNIRQRDNVLKLLGVYTIDLTKKEDYSR